MACICISLLTERLSGCPCCPEDSLSPSPRKLPILTCLVLTCLSGVPSDLPSCHIWGCTQPLILPPWPSPVTLLRAPSLGLLPPHSVSLGDLIPDVPKGHLLRGPSQHGEVPPLAGTLGAPSTPTPFAIKCGSIPLPPLAPPAPASVVAQAAWSCPLSVKRPPGQWPPCPHSPQRPHQLPGGFANRHI